MKTWELICFSVNDYDIQTAEKSKKKQPVVSPKTLLFANESKFCEELFITEHLVLSHHCLSFHGWQIFKRVYRVEFVLVAHHSSLSASVTGALIQIFSWCLWKTRHVNTKRDTHGTVRKLQ